MKLPSDSEASSIFKAQDFESAFNNSAIGMALVGPFGSWLHVNAALIKLFGYSREELGRLTFQDLTLEEDLEIGRTNMIALRSGEESSMTFEKRYVHKSGEIVYAMVNTTAVRGESGDLLYLISQIQDITEQKKAELQARLIMNSTMDGYWDWRIKDNYEYMSPRLWEMLGVDPETKRHHPKEWMDHLFEADQSKALESFKAHVRSRGEEPYFQELRFSHADGSTVWVIRKGQVVEWAEDGIPLRMVGSHTDITGLKVAERVLAQSSKMIALGEMASGIAHEINSPLAIIVGHASHLRDLAESGKLSHEDIINSCEKLEKTSMRISKVIRGLRLYSRNLENEEFQKTLVIDVIKDTLDICLEKFRMNEVEVRIKISDPQLYIYCRPVQMSQVFLNLLNNSFDALRDQEEKWIQIEAYRFEGDVRLVVSDSGKGVPKPIQDKIMRPFFTTKEVGEGTGLGLSICNGIIESHQGQFSFLGNQPHPSFSIRLPDRPLSEEGC
ncbi:PAS domain S-box protein [bacterium]|nr:PAS domain S-box protein [bacterium]